MVAVVAVRLTTFQSAKTTGERSVLPADSSEEMKPLRSEPVMGTAPR